MTALMDIEIIATFKNFLAEFAHQTDIEMLPLNMFVHVGGLVTGVATVHTAPTLLPRRVHSLNHLVLDYHIKVWISHAIS